jgi:hypothetical protein
MSNKFYLLFYLCLNFSWIEKILKIIPEKQRKKRKNSFRKRDFYGDYWAIIELSFNEIPGPEAISLIENIEEDKKIFNLS